MFIFQAAPEAFNVNIVQCTSLTVHGYLDVIITKQRAAVGAAAAAFFIAVFPGNIAQYTEGRSAFGLDTDSKRLARLFFQPVLVGWAWWSTRKK